jgi:predicted ATPase/DNA-binding winged helix-turn-helix (wHTH) protein
MADRAVSASEHAISFGPFRLIPKQRLLLEGDKQVRLGSRALDILIALLERPGEVVGKDELVARVWPNTTVEESNLKFQVGALRRTLGKGNRYLGTIPGRGYSFVAPLVIADQPTPAPPKPASSSPPHNLPIGLTGLIGRAETVDRLTQRVPQQRLLTIVGPGGIGKTSVALAVADRLLAAYTDGVWLVDLSPLSESRLVPSALAAVLGLEIRSENPLPSLVASLGDKQMLLVLDNCAHVIEAAASLAVGILRGAPRVHILATSREPLRVEGERVYRLSPLASPPVSAGLNAAEALAFPAVQLFVERAVENSDDFAFSDADVPLVADICRKLDGLPLAIEFAAARVEAFGVRGLAAHLDDRLRLLTSGRRTAVARHRTLSATLDWSYNLLSEAQQKVLRRLAIFAGGFTLHAAGVVAADAGQPEAEIIDQVAELVTKSLVAADVGDAEPRLRLFEITRAYARNKLAESGELDALGRRHAVYYRDLLEAAAQDKAAGSWPAAYTPAIDNVRAALEWAFSGAGDGSLAVALTIAAIPLWFDLSLFPECREHAERAIAAVAPNPSARSEMQLYSALAASLFYTKGPVPETCDAWTKVLHIAASLGRTEYQLRALAGLWGYRLNSGEYKIALTLAEDFGRLAGSQTDPAERLIADRMIGVSLHYLGDQANARPHLERVRDRYVAPPDHSHIARFQLDPRIAALSVLARLLWLQGFADRALRMAVQNVEYAREVGHAVSVFNALLGASQVAILAGDLTAATRYVVMLLDHSSRNAMAIFTAWAQGINGVLLIQQGDAAGLRILRATLEELSEVRSVPRYAVFFGPFATGLARTGQIAEGLLVIEEAIEQSERNFERWIIAEMLRIRGTLVQMQGTAEAARIAEEDFRRSLELAHRQGALAWELRTAISLARLQRGQGRIGEARDLLVSVYGRFTEGFGTADLQTAKRLLDELT